LLSGRPRRGRHSDGSRRPLARRRTGSFPIMHTVVMARRLVTERPGIVRAVYDGYLSAKNAGLERYRAGRKAYQVRSIHGPAPCSSRTASCSRTTGGPTACPRTGWRSIPSSATTTSRGWPPASSRWRTCSPPSYATPDLPQRPGAGILPGRRGTSNIRICLRLGLQMISTVSGRRISTCLSGTPSPILHGPDERLRAQRPRTT
jgi:hypothetical protein